MNLWVSADGGGTKTEICACDAWGKKVYSAFCEGTNYQNTGVQAVSEILERALGDMLSFLGCTLEDIWGFVFAAAGCDTRQDWENYREIMVGLGLKEEQFYICNDTEVIFRAMSETPGICAIAGTGSIACAYDEKGLMARVGGWGAPLSDEGSGYWIGAEILKCMLKWLDGAGEKLQVYDDISRRFAQKDRELAGILAGLTVCEIASVASLVLGYASQGEEKCCEIVREASRLIAQQIVILCNKVKWGKKLVIILVGGLFSSDLFRQSVEDGVKQQLAQEIVFLRPVHSPAEDGLIYARKLFPGNRRDEKADK